jgi:hypothetical protein
MSALNSPGPEPGQTEGPKAPVNDEAAKAEHRTKEQTHWLWQDHIGLAATILSTLALIGALVGYFSLRSQTEASWKTANEARRQADAAEKNIPRAWLFIEFPDKKEQTDRANELGRVPCAPAEHVELAFVPFGCITKYDHDDGTRSYNVTIIFSVHNYGQIPAIIESTEAYLFVIADPNRFSTFSPTPFDVQGHLANAVSCTKAGGLDDLSGTTVVSNGSVKLPPSTYFVLYNQRSAESFGFFRKWVWIIVKYRDPYGGSRETGYMAKVEWSGVSGVTDKRYTYNDNPQAAAPPATCSASGR